MDRGNSIIKMAAYMMGNGRRIKCTEKVFLYILIVGTLYYATGQPAYQGRWFED